MGGERKARWAKAGSLFPKAPFRPPLPVPEPTNDWLQEHLLIPHGRGWSNPLPSGQVDAAVKVKGVSRWNNFYVAGLQQLMHETTLDGERRGRMYR